MPTLSDPGGYIPTLWTKQRECWKGLRLAVELRLWFASPRLTFHFFSFLFLSLSLLSLSSGGHVSLLSLLSRPPSCMWNRLLEESSSPPKWRGRRCGDRRLVSSSYTLVLETSLQSTGLCARLSTVKDYNQRAGENVWIITTDPKFLPLDVESLLCLQELGWEKNC